MEPIVQQVTLNEGSGCWMTINRTTDGSYGTMAINSNDDYLLVFDDYVSEYQSKEPLGLVEKSNSFGWEPRTVFLANMGLVPSQF